MLLAIHPKLPMRSKAETKAFYVDQLGFEAPHDFYPDYLMVKKDQIEIHFFLYAEIDVKTNYGMCYIRTDDVDVLYAHALKNKLSISELGHLQDRPWRQREFALLDPSHNLLTFGQAL